MTHLNQNIITLLSQARLQGYDNDLTKHSQNLNLIAQITPKIALLEITIRNIVDVKLSKSSPNWIINRQEESIIWAKKSIDDRNKDINGNPKEQLTHHQYLSRFSLGNVIKIIEELKLYPLFFSFTDINFKDYHQSNRNFGFVGKQKTDFSRIDKVKIVLNIFWTLRNRCYHWDNLYKMRKTKTGIYPRLNYKLNATIISLAGENIDNFLIYLLDCIDKDLRKTLE